MVNYNNIVTAFEAFADKHLLLEGFSHGAPDSVDVEKVKRYPFLHLVYTGANYEVTGNAGNKTYAFEVYILGSPSTDNDESGVRVDVQTQAVSDIEQIAEDLLADIQQGHKVFDLGLHYGLNSARMTPLTDTRSNLLVGVLLDITIDLPYGFDACNPPLEGVTPAGSVLTSPVDTGSLTVREIDGTPNVSGVTTIQVTDGALTDAGGGIVTLDVGTGSVQTVNNVAPDSEGNVTISTGAATISELTDTDISTLADGQVLVYNSETGKWENEDQSSLAVGTAVSATTATNAVNVTGAQASEITANTAKISFPGFGTTAGTALEGNTTLTTSLDSLTDVDLTSTSNNETLVFNSTSNKFENGFPISAGQVSIFKRNSPASAAFSFGAGVTDVEFGSFLAGGVTYDNEIRAGAAFGLGVNHKVLNMLPVSVGSTISVEISYDITLDTSGVAQVGEKSATGQLQNGTPATQTEFDAGTVTRTLTGTTESVSFFSTSNSLSFAIASNVSGTFRPHYIKVTITHA